MVSSIKMGYFQCIDTVWASTVWHTVCAVVTSCGVCLHVCRHCQTVPNSAPLLTYMAYLALDWPLIPSHRWVSSQWTSWTVGRRSLTTVGSIDASFVHSNLEVFYENHYLNWLPFTITLAIDLLLTIRFTASTDHRCAQTLRNVSRDQTVFRLDLGQQQDATAQQTRRTPGCGQHGHHSARRRRHHQHKRWQVSRQWCPPVMASVWMILFWQNRSNMA